MTTPEECAVIDATRALIVAWGTAQYLDDPPREHPEWEAVTSALANLDKSAERKPGSVVGGDEHRCDTWPSEEVLAESPCDIYFTDDGTWNLYTMDPRMGSGDYGWTIRFCPFCGEELGKECALCVHRHRMPDRASGCDCACHTESPTEVASVDPLVSAEACSATSAEPIDLHSVPVAGSSPRILVDELRIWPHAKRPFLKGSCHLMVEIVGEVTEEKAIEALHVFAEKIGMRRAWFQLEPYGCSHYDLTPGRRVRAIAAGAVFVPALEQARRRKSRRLSESP